jgi:hypothetical protein
MPYVLCPMSYVVEVLLYNDVSVSLLYIVCVYIVCVYIVCVYVVCVYSMCM